MNGNVRIKTGKTQAFSFSHHLTLIEPIDNPFRNGEFDALHRRAEQLDNHYNGGASHNTSFGNDFAGFGTDMNTNMNMNFNNGYDIPFTNTMDGNHDLHMSDAHQELEFAVNSAMGMNSMGYMPDLVNPASRMHISPSPGLNPQHSFGDYASPKKNIPVQATYGVPHQSVGPSHSHALISSQTTLQAQPRARSVRTASRQATEGVSQLLQAEKAKDKEDGERSSVEDSAESQFEESDDGGPGAYV